MGANGHRRVVITGLGAVTPLGADVATTWERLIAGRSAAGPITAFDARGFTVRFACEATDFDPTRWINHRQARRMGRFAQLVVAAARQAEADAQLELESEAHRVGVSVGSAMGGLHDFELCCETLIEQGPERVNPFAIPMIVPNMGAAWVSIELGTRGPLGSQCTACAASQMARASTRSG
jgi:3-oxoacyl-[acyl-carrier-protein] synthase II